MRFRLSLVSKVFADCNSMPHVPRQMTLHMPRLFRNNQGGYKMANLNAGSKRLPTLLYVHESDIRVQFEARKGSSSESQRIIYSTKIL